MTDPLSSFRGFELYPFQRLAIEALKEEHSVIVAAPTGAGKTLVADFAIEKALRHGERIVYTSPVKALSNQKFRDFREISGDQVGIMTGDVTINPDASLLIMTTEVFRNTLFEDPRRLDEMQYVIFDEVHYLDDRERGTVWEESIIFAPDHMRFLCLSATVPNVRELASWIEEIRGGRAVVVESHVRPVPLNHFIHVPGSGIVPIEQARQKLRQKRGRGRQSKFAGERELLDLLESRNLLPCLYFCFSRKDCEKLAKANARRSLLEPDQRKRILSLFDELAELYELKPGAQTERLRQAAGHGCMYHHAGILPIYKEIVERLFTTGLVKLLFTTETFALGVNMPARTVIFHMLKKFDGIAFDWLRTRDYFQMAGRAGRPGLDDVGHVVSRLDPRWDDPAEAHRVITGKVEGVRSRFNLSYSGLLSLYERLGEGLREAYLNSFARYQRNRMKGKTSRKAGGGRGGKTSPEERTIDKRLRVLHEAGYIDDAGLTRKGRIAEYLNGYEVQAAELHDFGVFHLASEVQLAILMVAVVFEERKGDASARLDPQVLAEIKPLSERRMREFRRIEFEAGLEELSKEPDFRMASPTHAWAKGKPLEEIRQMTSISDGDLVRNFRMAIQLMRQVRGQLVGERDLPQKFDRAIEMMNRDEVDARRQLELG